MKEEVIRNIIKDEFNNNLVINSDRINTYIKQLELNNQLLQQRNQELELKLEEYKEQNLLSKKQKYINKKDATMNEQTYNAVLKILKCKKADVYACNYLKDYNLDNLFNDIEFINRIKEDYDDKVIKTYDDNHISKFILAKYTAKMKKFKFSLNLKHISQSKGITISEMAKRLDLTISTVSDWYNGVNFPRLDKLYLIADILDVDIEQLIKGE